MKKILLTLATLLLITSGNNEKELREYDVQCKVEVTNFSGIIDTINYRKNLCLRDSCVSLRYSGRNNLFLNYNGEYFFPKSDPLASNLFHYRILKDPKAALIKSPK